MFPDTFEVICKYISEIDDDKLLRRYQVSIDKQLMVTLWYLANAESFRTVSSRFNLAEGSCWRILYRTCEKLLKINIGKGIIKWPSESEQRIVAAGFSKFPGIVGCIDGCHFKISPPKENHTAYINRKNYHSILLQGICNDKKEFIDCYVGEVGSVHDATVLKRSPIFNKILNGVNRIPDDMHILGDSAYPLSKYILTPYRNIGNLSDAKKKYNICLSKSRVRIENTFGIMKSRFRRLKLIENKKINCIVIIIMSCCILHNICMHLNDVVEPELRIAVEDIESASNELITREGQAKRERICNSLQT